MGRKRDNGISPEKTNIIGQHFKVYGIKTVADAQEALKDLLGGTIQNILEAELDQQIEEQEEADANYNDSRNGYKAYLQRSFQPDAALKPGRYSHPDPPGSQQRLRAEDCAEVSQGHQRDRGQD